MSQNEQLREYELVEMMLHNRQQLIAEFIRIAGERGEEELQAFTDRDKIRAILNIEFPSRLPSFP
jgi:hypothetical protein